MDTVQKEVVDNQALLDEMDEMDLVPSTYMDEEESAEEQVGDEDNEETEEETEDPDTEEDEAEEDDGPTEDEDGPEEQEEESETETETDDQNQTPDADEVDDATALRMQINELNQKILDLQSGITPAPEEPAPVEIPAPVSTPTQKILQASLAEDYDFFQGQSMDDVLDDPKKFNEALRGFATQVSQNTIQNTMLSIPEIVKHHTVQQTAVLNTVNTFYKENPDLNPIRATVAQVCNQVASEHSDWSIEKVFTESAVRTRKMLKMVKAHKTSKPNTSNLETDPNKTNIKGKSKSRKSKPKNDRRTKLQKQIDEF